MKKSEKRAILVFLFSMVLTILIHYFFISKFNLHSTIHVVISLILFWIFLSISSLIKKKKNKK